MNNFSEEQNQQRRIEEIEAEIEHEFPPNSENSGKIPVSSPSFSHVLSPIKHWFQALPTVGKIIVTFGGFIIGLSLLKTVFTIVTSLITLIIIGGVVYLGYKFLIKS